MSEPTMSVDLQYDIANDDAVIYFGESGSENPVLPVPWDYLPTLLQFLHQKWSNYGFIRQRFQQLVALGTEPDAAFERAAWEHKAFGPGVSIDAASRRN